jgi:hypothetical protein
MLVLLCLWLAQASDRWVVVVDGDRSAAEVDSELLRVDLAACPAFDLARFWVTAQGRVRAPVQLVSRDGDPRAQRCVDRALQAARFREMTHETRIDLQDRVQMREQQTLLGGAMTGVTFVVPDTPDADADAEAQAAVSGALAREQVALEGCYAAARARDPGVRGAVRLELWLAKDGAVARAELNATTVADAEIGGCLLDAARHLVVPYAHRMDDVPVGVVVFLEPVPADG